MTKATSVKLTKVAKLNVVSGVGGIAIYINDLRVTPRHTKPLGGGRILHTLEVEVDQVRAALAKEKKDE